MGTLAYVSVRFNCPECDHRPIRVGDAKCACPVCGAICWDAVALIKSTFGPGVERCITRGPSVTSEVEDWEIERMLDA